VSNERHEPYTPKDPAQQAAWDRMWDLVIAKALPHVLAYIEEQEERERRELAGSESPSEPVPLEYLHKTIAAEGGRD
jgi:hypothetical protein